MSRAVVREVSAGIAGFLFFMLASALLFYLAGYDPHAPVSNTFKVVSILAGILFGVIAGYLVALISPRSPLRPAVMVALLIAVSAILSMLESASGEAWSQTAALLLMAPAVVMGARSRVRVAGRRIQSNAYDASPPNGAI